MSIENKTETNENKALIEIQTQINNLVGVHRIVSNVLAIVSEYQCRREAFGAVEEAAKWLEGFKGNLQVQQDALKAALPKEEAIKIPEVVS